MKISVKWILVLTALVGLPLGLSENATIVLIIACGLGMCFALPFVAFLKWKIDDKDGWWKFNGGPVARFAVWVFTICAFELLVSVVKLINLH